MAVGRGHPIFYRKNCAMQQKSMRMGDEGNFVVEVVVAKEDKKCDEVGTRQPENGALYLQRNVQGPTSNH